MNTSADARPSLDAGSRAWTLAAAAACLLPLLLQLPLSVALGSAALAVITAALSWRRPMPALLRFVLAIAILLTVSSAMGWKFGRDTGCALLAAMLAIKPSETGSLRDARSLLAFALFAPFAAFLLDQGPTTLLLSALGVLGALVALGRLAEFEARGQRLQVALRQRLWSVARLILIGMPLVLAAFWLFPRFAEPLWGVPGKALATPGLSDRMSPGGWLDLMSDDTPALRVQFFGPAPSQQQMYWRGMVFWDFDGREWTRAPSVAAREPAEVRSAALRWDYSMAVEGNEQPWLVALDLPASAPPGARLDHDNALIAARPMTALTQWRVQSSPPLVFESRLPRELYTRALLLPVGLNPRTRALGEQWRQQAGNGVAADTAIVNRALAWIRRDFAYTLDTPLPGRDGADEFLFDQQAGYCEHFSSAFTVLMRSAGVPARVVVGYAGGVRNPFGDYWVVRNQDAHAWTEVWLAGRGWVRVDPTAAVAPERIYDTVDDRQGAAGQGFANGRTWAQLSDWMRRGWNDMVLGFDARRQSRMLQDWGLRELDTRRLAVMFAVVTTLVLAGMGWLLARGEREPDPLLRAWHRLGRRYTRLGLAPLAHEPALTWAQRVASTRGKEAGDLVSLSQRFADSRYAAAHSDMSVLLRDLRRHRP
ncbi:transglutaminaseTgpA domain-containing protein [Pseudoxanthomonas indica]|uniref:Transglutaminase-like superfamily protein n=1 Tax=Pseudoxanthomonas indica TaxID=428993 RepID=A0A1T5LV45_9GAMM|nr:DUF3488 and transglutaminase-like domain-containing protein [Pseudoxanthomonas indica]GGD39513.1 membrane protein [Pseudoxanthomonas indica]SKC79479.1 Transglutaminase-like superfamily protein [Pseudoxanthomonas indica]